MKNKPTLPNPFPGLRSFRSDEDYLFFGREEQTLELVTRLQRNRFIAVVGTSGRGKSSLVRCGLLSRLQGGGMVEAGAHWEIAVMHPGGDPLRHLAAALLEAGLYDREAEDALPHLLATLGRSQFGLIEAVRQAKIPAGTNFLLVVDQFEEIFRYDEAGKTESEVANDFIAMLREASAQTEVPIYIVTTMRSDFIGDCSRFEGLAEAVNRGEYLIPGLNRDQFKAAIEGPIRVAGGQLAPRLLQRLLNDLGEEQDQLPCLQHALMRTWRVWQARADAPAIDLEDYAQVGKMSQALSLHADEVFSGLATDRQRELCAAMFKALTVEGSEKRGIRRPRRLQTLCGILGVEAAELTPIIDAFRHPEVSFLMPPSDVPLKDTTVIDLSHESLMRVWTRLRDWVEDEAKSVGIFRRLSESAALWRQGKSGFYRDPELSIARAWLESSRPNALWAQQYDGSFDEALAFLHGSSDAAQAESRAQEAARQHELEQARALAEAERQRAEQQAQFAARLKWFVRGLGLVAMVAVAAMFIAFAARREAQENAAHAQKSEAKAQAAGAMVDKARGQAEKLVSFLLDDFYAELEPTGRVDTVAKLAREALAYFDGLPAELRSTVTRRNRAIAELRLGQAVHRSGKYEDGSASIKKALDALEQLHSAGDRSEPTLIGLAAALRAYADALRVQAYADRGDTGELRGKLRARGLELLRPLATAEHSSMASRLEFAEALTNSASSARSTEDTRPLLDEARDVLLTTGALAGTNYRATSAYAHATLELAVRTRNMRRETEAAPFYAEALALAEKVLAVQPGDLRALHVSADTNWWLTVTDQTADNAEALRRHFAAVDAFELIVRFNPADAQAWENVINVRRSLGARLLQEGRIDESIRNYHAAFDTAKRQKSNVQTLASLPDAALNICNMEAQRGNRPAAEAALAEAQRLRSAYEAEQKIAAGSMAAELWKVSYRQQEFMLIWHMFEYEKFVAAAKNAGAKIEALLARAGVTASDRRSLEFSLHTAEFNVGRGNLFLGKWAETETHMRKAIALRDDDRQTNFQATRQYLTVALARQGRIAEASEVLKSAKMETLEAVYARGNRALFTRQRLARGLYAESFLQPDDDAGRQKKQALLRRGVALLEESTEEGKQISEQRELRRLIDEELAKLPAKTE